MQLLGLLAKLPTGLLVTSLALAASALPVGSVELKELTPDNFTRTVAEGAWFVEHYSPYCPHCRAFAPTWEKLVDHYESLDDPGVQLAQVNCAANGDLCHKNGVTGYPQMMMYKNGEVVEQFKGSRDWENIISFVDKHAIHTPVKAKVQEEPVAQVQQKSLPNPEGMVKALDPSSFDALLEDGPAFIKFYAPWCGHCKKLAPTWTQLAAQLRHKVNVAEVNCDIHKGLCTKQNIKGFPTLFYYSGGTGSNMHKTEYTGGRKLEQLRRFAEMAVAPTLQELDSEAEFEHYVKEYPVLYLFLHSPGDSEALDELKEASKVLLGSPKVVTSTNSELRRRFSLPEAYASSPILLAIKDNIPHSYTALFSFSSPSPSLSISKQKQIKEKEVLKEWLLHHRVPSVTALTQDTFQGVMGAPHHPLVVIAAVKPEVEDSARERLKEVARSWRGVLDRARVVSVSGVDVDPKQRGKERARDVVFAWMDAVRWGSWLKSMYGISAGSEEEPSVVIADHGELIYYNTDAKGNKIAFDTQSITSAVTDVLAGKVSYINSENILERMARRIEKLFTYLETSVAAHPYRTIFIVVGFIVIIFFAIRRVVGNEEYGPTYAEYTRLQKEPGRLD